MWWCTGLHELDPVFRRVTLQNPRLKQLAKDLAIHKDPRGASRYFLVPICADVPSQFCSRW